jgi:hypothetical protein
MDASSITALDESNDGRIQPFNLEKTMFGKVVLALALMLSGLYLASGTSAFASYQTGGSGGHATTIGSGTTGAGVGR